MNETHIPFEIRRGVRGTAAIQLHSIADGFTLVVCMNENTEDEAPVNRAIQALFKEVCRRFELDSSRVVWIEYCPETISTLDGAIGGWEVVTQLGIAGSEPVWRRMTEADWQHLGIEPLPQPVSQIS